MKEKRLTALFISSIVAVVASLAISLGVVFALADPVAAVGLHEYSFNLTANTAKEEIFSPVGYYNGKLDDYNNGVVVNNYDEILYTNEALVDDVKLFKAQVSNNTGANARFTFDITVDGETNAKDYVEIAIIDAVTQQIYFVDRTTGKTEEITLNADKTGKYVIAAYVTDYNAAERIDLSGYMKLQINVSKINID